MSTFTPGPWFVTNPESNGTLYVESRIRSGWLQEVASCGPTEDPEHRAANARLIAAAPELLEALQELLASDRADQFAIVGKDHYGHPVSAPGMARIKARAAIAKALGEA